MTAKKSDAEQSPSAEAVTNENETQRAEVVNDPARRLDETQPGGRYIVNDTVVDANGKPIKE